MKGLYRRKIHDSCRCQRAAPAALGRKYDVNGDLDVRHLPTPDKSLLAQQVKYKRVKRWNLADLLDESGDLLPSSMPNIEHFYISAVTPDCEVTTTPKIRGKRRSVWGCRRYRHSPDKDSQAEIRVTVAWLSYSNLAETRISSSWTCARSNTCARKRKWPARSGSASSIKLAWRKCEKCADFRSCLFCLFFYFYLPYRFHRSRLLTMVKYWWEKWNKY